MLEISPRLETSAEVRSEGRFDDELTLAGNLHNFYATQIARARAKSTPTYESDMYA